MTDLIPIKLEARLVGLSKQRRKDGDWIEVKFHIHPDEKPHALFILPLGTDCTLSIKGVPESAEEAAAGNQAETEAEEAGNSQEQASFAPAGTAVVETPQERSTADWSEAKRKMVQRSGILRNSEAFQDYIRAGWPVLWTHERHKDASAADRAAYFIRTNCYVDSCRDLDPNNSSGRRFREMDARYEESKSGQSLDQMKEARDR